MIEEIEEFLKQEKVSAEHNITLWSEKQQKWLHINPKDFIDRYNKFLRKKSYLK